MQTISYSRLGQPLPQPVQAAPRPPKRRWPVFGLMLVLILVACGAAAVAFARRPAGQQPAANAISPTVKTQPAAVNYCAGNAKAQYILVSISKRHLWACSGTTEKYNSAVVTGMQNLAADLTPPGSYTIYAKQTDLYLNGADGTGSWHDYVYYWMPFLSNKYGIYGFHDATWRAPGDFGNIDPYSKNASHGCVELPLATAKWLYDWAPVGTTVTIES